MPEPIEVDDALQKELDEVRGRLMEVERHSKESFSRVDRRFEALDQLSARMDDLAGSLEGTVSIIQSQAKGSKALMRSTEGHDKTDHAELHELWRRLQETERHQEESLSRIAKSEERFKDWDRLYTRVDNLVGTFEGPLSFVESKSAQQHAQEYADSHDKADGGHAGLTEFRGSSLEAVRRQALLELSSAMQIIQETLQGRLSDHIQEGDVSINVQDSPDMMAESLAPSSMELAQRIQGLGDESDWVQRVVFQLDVSCGALRRELHEMKKEFKKQIDDLRNKNAKSPTRRVASR